MRRRFRFRRRQLKAAHLLALIALAVVVGLLSRGGWLYGLRQRLCDPFPPKISGFARLIDGDSLWVGIYEVRLKGIDAPEGSQTCLRSGAAWNCGNAAREALSHMIGWQTVTCDVSERDIYSRLLAKCHVGDRDLNAAMVSTGMAVAYGGYWKEEGEAKAARRGIWASDFQTPRQWRNEHRQSR
jgi:endonuclease YncB( thermonuclease family)